MNQEIVHAAQYKDLGNIVRLIDYGVELGSVLPRDLQEIEANQESFFIALDQQGLVVGCVSLMVCDPRIAEVRTLIVAENYQNNGVGSALVKQAVCAAKEFGIEQLFTVTKKPEIFEKHGFQLITETENKKTMLIQFV